MTDNASVGGLRRSVPEDGSFSSSLVGTSCFAPVFKLRMAISRSCAGLAFIAWALCRIEVALITLPLKRNEGRHVGICGLHITSLYYSQARLEATVP